MANGCTIDSFTERLENENEKEKKDEDTLQEQCLIALGSAKAWRTNRKNTITTFGDYCFHIRLIISPESSILRDQKILMHISKV